LKLVQRSIEPYFFAVLCAAWGSVGCGGDCEEVGASWCRGDSLQECVRKGGGGHRSPYNGIVTTSCATDGMICDEGAEEARCVFGAPRCVDDVEAVCVGNVLAKCEAGESFPVPARDCSLAGVDAAHCVQSDLTARCSPFPELCPEEGAARCDFDRVLTCKDHIWIAPFESGAACFGQCSTENATQCIETTDGLNRPLALVAKCTGAPGLWKHVGPICQTECACGIEQGAPCRCLEWSEDFDPL
jgi:hypothetical protein